MAKSTWTASAALFVTIMGANSVQATPYAFGSNQITALTLTTTAGRITPSVFNETISDSSAFSGFAPATAANGASDSTNKLTISQAYSGPGNAGSIYAGFGAAGPGAFTGTRSNSMIGAGSAVSGGVAVSNVAEGYGSAPFGTSAANDKATIGFVVVGTGTSVVLSFTDTYQLAASTALLLGETANASIQNTFSITDGTNTTIATFSPAALNATIGSSNGSPGNTTVGPITANFSFTSPVLTLGTSYTLALTSGSAENISAPAPVPEPATLALIATGMLGLGFLRRKPSK